ncbi:MAG: TonB-dependent receptor [Chitinophagaceae bacterium]|nr:TonB-dependent receptor [Chitinophagaceae bacterium]MCB9055861.1 TonB-dependent receptor [Chitinophagales bacterium]
MKRFVLSIAILVLCIHSNAQQQQGRPLKLTIVNDAGQALPAASVYLLTTDSVEIQVQGSDQKGIAEFEGLQGNDYLLKVSHTGYQTVFLNISNLQQQSGYTEKITLQQQASSLQGVTVTSNRPFVQFDPDKTVINVDAGITNAGATVMDVLQKSPGITVSREGAIIMKGKPSVMVLIDGKQTQLSGEELQAYLSGMSASQVDVIELIDNPGAKYDAAGNAGIINIKTKKIRQRGFNGSLSLSLGQGFYTKSNNSLNLNYRNGKFNVYLNYGNRLGKEMMNLFALRKYFDANGNDSLLLRQPNFSKTGITAHTLKAGIDFFASNKTTLGVSFTGVDMDREAKSVSSIDWMSPAYVIDSTIKTWGTRDTYFNRSGFNFNGRHSFNSDEELSADIDVIQFRINGGQSFQTQVSTPGSPIQATKGNVPATLEIFTAKLDYSKRFRNFLWEAGFKTATTNTDNLTEYFFNDGNTWYDDLGRSNHFLYDENINAVYSSIDMKDGKWHWQAGLRYEHTGYKANQLGNAAVKDSSFTRNYASIFPSAFVSYDLDSNNTFTFRMGRRIDRPPFQNLNPFLITLNKYTFMGGNPYIRPQYTWNFEIIHTFKQILSTSISYNYLKDYFSQIFIIDTNSSNVNKNIIIYTRGNVGSFHNIGATVTLQLPVTKWWNLTSVAVYNHKIIQGVVWVPLRAEVDQLNISLNNQFQLKKGWAAELGGYYQTNSQIDLQESLTPQGELGAGISKQILKNKGTLRFTVRDMFYTQNYSGYSRFENSDEPFEVKWDSRVFRITFNWRFGKPMKTVRRSSGGATEETERVGTGN